MTKIGTFTETDTGFIGSIVTLTLKVDLEIVQHQNSTSKKKVPGYKVIEESGYEVGTGWFPKDPSKNHVNITIDSPELPAPIYARLVKDKHENVHNLYWDRLKPKKKSGTETTGAERTDDEIPY